MLIKDKTHTLRNRYFLLMIVLTLIELSALISKPILTTRSYCARVDFIVEKESTELRIEQELLFNKLDLLKKHAYERERENIDEFFAKSIPTKNAKNRPTYGRMG